MSLGIDFDEGLGARASALAERLELPLAAHAPLRLHLTRERLELRSAGCGAVYADFVGGRAAHRRTSGGGRRQLLARAVGFKGRVTPHVIDATAGLGRDAFVLAGLGAKVTMLERHPVIAALLEDALARALSDPQTAPIAATMTLCAVDSTLYLNALKAPCDVVYLDPMYPHTGKRALQKKEMRLLQKLLGAPGDEAALLDAARRAAKRVVVKRPLNGAYLAGVAPHTELKSKNTRFDLYLSA